MKRALPQSILFEYPFRRNRGRGLLIINSPSLSSVDATLVRIVICLRLELVASRALHAGRHAVIEAAYKGRNLE